MIIIEKKIMGLEGLLSRLNILWSTKQKNGFGVDKVNVYKTNKLWGRSLLFFICQFSKHPVEGSRVSKTSELDIPSYSLAAFGPSNTTIFPLLPFHCLPLDI